MKNYYCRPLKRLFLSSFFCLLTVLNYATADVSPYSENEQKQFWRFSELLWNNDGDEETILNSREFQAFEKDSQLSRFLTYHFAVAKLDENDILWERLKLTDMNLYLLRKNDKYLVDVYGDLNLLDYAIENLYKLKQEALLHQETDGYVSVIESLAWALHRKGDHLASLTEYQSVFDQLAIGGKFNGINISHNLEIALPRMIESYYHVGAYQKTIHTAAQYISILDEGINSGTFSRDELYPVVWPYLDLISAALKLEKYDLAFRTSQSALKFILEANDDNSFHHVTERIHTLATVLRVKPKLNEITKSDEFISEYTLVNNIDFEKSEIFWERYLDIQDPTDWDYDAYPKLMKEIGITGLLSNDIARDFTVLSAIRAVMSGLKGDNAEVMAHLKAGEAKLNQLVERHRLDYLLTAVIALEVIGNYELAFKYKERAEQLDAKIHQSAGESIPELTNRISSVLENAELAVLKANNDIKNKELQNSRFKFAISILVISLMTISLFFLVYRHRVMKNLASTDSLTGALTRRAIAPLLENFNFSPSRPVCIALIDLDHFKKLNDSYGHLFGDEVLKEFVEFVKSRLRRTDKIARYGGEEFLVILDNSNEQEAKMVLDSIRDNFSQKANWSNTPKRVSVSFSSGIVEVTTQSSIGEIIKVADELLYDAKNSGRGCSRTLKLNAQPAA